MKFLLVGGAVRDELLGRDRSDRDWLILGADHDALLSRGFRAVGQHFTVYLHPETHEEYALPRGPDAARDERGQSALIADLERRDFTINAMARDSEGQLHDPFGG
ncbi:MAG: multifunctional CCA tRNA nucleotidyl transferase/2'3'-cyclic phosphodiesterase/2'nucleotidase/phosphatase, partial [Gammaproteobacteria bacterium]